MNVLEEGSPADDARGERSLQSVEDLAWLLASGHAVQAETGGATSMDSLAHALQCADILAARHPDDVELQLAGLVHDIAHHLPAQHPPLSGADPIDLAEHDRAHGRLGAVLVQSLLGERVANLVELHVSAKRYLVRFDAAYGAHLSAVSRRTLANQGGSMPDDEVLMFLADPDALDALELRRADDDAKEPGRVTTALAVWTDLMREFVECRHNSGTGDAAPAGQPTR